MPDVKHILSMKNEIALLLLAIFFLIGVVGSVYMVRQSLAEEKVLAENRLRSIQNRYQQAKDRERLMKEYRQKFTLLEKTNIVGEENRLDWVDQLDRIVKERRIPYIKYRVLQQQQFTDRKLLSRYPFVDVYQSAMELDMALLHEGDLYSLINGLDNKAKGLFDIQECVIQRADIKQVSALDSIGDRNFKAKCILLWYTFKPLDS